LNYQSKHILLIDKSPQYFQTTKRFNTLKYNSRVISYKSEAHLLTSLFSFLVWQATSR